MCAPRPRKIHTFNFDQRTTDTHVTTRFGWFDSVHCDVVPVMERYSQSENQPALGVLFRKITKSHLKPLIFEVVDVLVSSLKFSDFFPRIVHDKLQGMSSPDLL